MSDVGMPYMGTPYAAVSSMNICPLYVCTIDDTPRGLTEQYLILTEQYLYVCTIDDTPSGLMGDTRILKRLTEQYLILTEQYLHMAGATPGSLMGDTRILKRLNKQKFHVWAD